MAKVKKTRAGAGVGARAIAETQALINERLESAIIERVKEILNKHTHLQTDADGHYICEIYTDYRDELCESTIQRIFMADNARDAFYESLDFFDYECHYESELIDTIKIHFDNPDDDDNPMCFSKHEDFIRNWLYENVIYNYPYDHYLAQDVYINIIVDTGDGNYDYTQNELFGCNYSEKGLEGRNESSLVWLMKQQGYDMTAITGFVENENMQGSKLFKSIYQECRNTGTCMNALTFFAKLTLKEALRLHEHSNNIQFNERGYVKSYEEKDARIGEITLDKSIVCGLYDPWNGSGSLLDIELEHDVALPLKYIDSAMPDGCRGCSVSRIYGMSRSFWSDGVVTIQLLEVA